ncbi:MAG: DUF4982 domain-containing protein, partial [Bacteroidota bacterium]|nr:DUF4982 domain-containing protein [Bacteroidota bacterium]
MRKALILAALTALLATGLRAQEIHGTNHGTELFNEGWKFALTEVDASAPAFNDKGWRTLDLPHDWGVEGDFVQEYPGETGKLAWWGQAWYRKHLQVTEDDLRGLVLLQVDGAMSNATVWVNGQNLGGWPYGYASWEVDLTPALKVGDNVIAIHIDNLNDSSRWYPGGGIYRNVWLRRCYKTGPDYNGIAVTTDIGEGAALVNVAMTVRQRGTAGLRYIFVVTEKSENLDDLDKVNWDMSYNGEVSQVADGQVIRGQILVKQPQLWSIDNPHLYALHVITVPTDEAKSAIVDHKVVSFGIRSAEFKPDGFYLNGEKTFLKGVCLHHDAGGLGAAWNRSAWIRRLNMLKDMGCNAIRSSHNPPAPDLLALCDGMGFLVMDELTDTWTYSKKPNGYATLFEDWVEKDLVAMIRRDRNHPSVILWSIGNECYEQGDSTRWWIPRMLTDIAHREDPTRLTTAGNDNVWAASTGYAETIDVYGFNYKPHAYEKFRDEHPNQPFLGSETASCISTRGYYMFPVEQDKGKGWVDGGYPFQVSSYDLYAPAWASKPDYEWFYEDQVPECAGEFVWTGFDYLGEPTPYNLDLSVLSNFHTEEEKEAYRKMLESWGQNIADVPLPSRSSYFGIIDLAGFPKDRYWLYQSRWREDLPVCHILPHWNWKGREGEVTPVHVYTNGEAAELFLNGKSLGVRHMEEGQYRLVWDDVVYEPGRLTVAAFKNGEVWATDIVETTGDPASLSLTYETGHGPRPEYGGVEEDSRVIGDNYLNPNDLIILDLRVLDKQQRIVPTADNLVKIKIKGDAELVYVDAGDPTSHTAFKSKE